MRESVDFKRRGRKWQLVTCHGRPLSGAIFDSIIPFRCGGGVGRIDGFGAFLFDEWGRRVGGQAFDRVVEMGDALVIEHGGKCCVLDLCFRLLVPWGDYRIELGPSEGIYVLRSGVNYGYGGGGRLIAPCQYSNYRSFRNGFAVVKWREDKWGLINARGELVVPDIYDVAECEVSEGVLAVCMNERWGFVDTQGRVVIPFAYEMADQFREGYAWVKILGGEWRRIDHYGRFVDGRPDFSVPEELRSQKTSFAGAVRKAHEFKRLDRRFRKQDGVAFKTETQVEIRYLIHYSAPYTGSGVDRLPKGVRLILKGLMNDCAYYCEIESEAERVRIKAKELERANRDVRFISRFTGVSFYVTKDQLSDVSLFKRCRQGKSVTTGTPR